MTVTAEDRIRLSKSSFKAVTTGEFDPGRFQNIITGRVDADDRT